jgi:hypothetical protein
LVIEAGDGIGTRASKEIGDPLTTPIKVAKDVLKPPPKKIISEYFSRLILFQL